MAKEQRVNLPEIQIKTVVMKVFGTSPYMPEPMDMAVLERYNQIKSKQKYSKDDIPEEEKVLAKFYYTDDGELAIPSRAFYNAMIRASSYLFEKKNGGMRNIKEGVTILGDMLPIKFKKQKVLTHWGRMSGMAKAPRKIMRNAFYDWEVELAIQYNSSNLSAEQIINVLEWAGFHIGVGAFRKEKTGNFGAFTIKA